MSSVIWLLNFLVLSLADGFLLLQILHQTETHRLIQDDGCFTGYRGGVATNQNRTSFPAATPLIHTTRQLSS